MKRFVLYSVVFAGIIALAGLAKVHADSGVTYVLGQNDSADSQTVDIWAFGASVPRLVYHNSDLKSGQKFFKYEIPEVLAPVKVEAFWIDNKTGQPHHCSAYEEEGPSLFDIATELRDGKCIVKVD
jgi:hypothetical protein